MQQQQIKNCVQHFAVEALCLAIPLGSFYLLHAYDWNHPIIRALAYLVLGLGFLFAWSELRRRLSRTSRPADLLLILVATLCLLNFVPNSIAGNVKLNDPPKYDIGSTTQDAARILFVEHANPYASKKLSVIGGDPRFYGFKYGPTMIAGYALSAYFPRQGFKYSSLVFLSISLLLTLSLVAKEKPTNITLIAQLVFALTIFLSSQRLWYELFTQGVNDIFPVMLLLLAFVLLHRQKYLLTGLSLGLSISAKFSPGLFFLLVLGPLLFNRRLILGLLLGLSPLVPFLLWDYQSILDNFIFFHGTKPPDSTSLMSLVPSNWWWCFSVLQVSAMFGSLALSFRRRPSSWSVIYYGSLLLTFIEITYREVHGNHLIWFVPLAAIILAQPKPARELGSDSGAGTVS